MPEETPVDKTPEQVEQERRAQVEVQNRARIQGWVPKEEFRGDQQKWITADEFVKRADHMMPILKSVNRKLEGQVSDLHKKLSDTQGMIEKMTKIQEKYVDDSYVAKRAELRTQKRKAAEEGRWDDYNHL